MSSTVQLSASRLRRSYKIGSRTVDVLKGIDLDIVHGESVFLVGASGAGKTTLMYTLAGLEKPEEGTVIFEGRRFTRTGTTQSAGAATGGSASVFQGYFLLPELTALENVLLPAMIGSTHGPQAKARAESILERVGLADRMHHLPAELSGGEQQRVAIARSLINGPSLLFADEPTGNLDSRTGATVIDLLLSLVRESQGTLVVVTHDASLAERGDRRFEIRRRSDCCLIFQDCASIPSFHPDSQPPSMKILHRRRFISRS
jgi:putative ABC transport system ATP-binding protein/lipoprotein-releasing system ATP-binding protein